MAHQDPPDFPDDLEIQDPQEMMAILANKVPQAQSARQVETECPECLEMKDCPAKEERRVMLVIRVILEQRVRQDFQVFLDRKENRDPEALLVSRSQEFQERMEGQVWTVPQAERVNKDCPVLEVLPEIRSTVFQAPQVPEAHRARKATMVATVSQVFPEYQARRVIAVALALFAVQE